MEDVHLQGVIVRKLDDELRVAASWDNCTLTARPGAKECSLQVKSSKYLVLIFLAFFFNGTLTRSIDYKGVCVCTERW